MNDDFIKEAMMIPVLTSFNNVLFIGPHPDDIEIGAGGLVAKLRRLNKKISFLIATDGSSGTRLLDVSPEELIKTRKQEALNASKLLNVDNIFFLPFVDGGIYSVDEMTTEIAKIIVKVKPDLIIAPDPLMPNETHPDHLNVGEASRRSLVVASYPNALRSRGVSVTEETPSNFTLGFYYSSRCNTIVDLLEEDIVMQKKAISCHLSQIDESFEYMFKYLELRARKFGAMKGSLYGEGYFILKPLHQHCFMEKID